VQQAQAGEAQRELDIVSLTRLIKTYTDSAKRHVLVVGHSEGSVLTQLAVLRLKSDLGFSEIRSPRCVGTMSVAGAGTANWPLSDRHARFVVAKHDFVTLLPGALRNTRPTIEDADTRAADAVIASLEQAVDAANSPGARIGAYISLHTYRALVAKEIHGFARYLRSDEDWPVISAGLDALYRTCALGAVALTPPSATLQLFGNARFHATWQALDGLPLQTADTVKWTIDTSLASVSPNGHVSAGSRTGATPLVATVRMTTGMAAVTIADDSLRATYMPPRIDAVETRRYFFNPFPGPEIGPANLNWGMTISAAAMSGATIEQVDVYVRRRDSTSVEDVAYSGPLPPGEFRYQSLPYNSDGTPVSWAFDIYSRWDFSWYRVVLTDSHGLKVEYVGSSADPYMLP